MGKITFSKNCCIETNKTFLSDHNNSKKHRDTEDYFIMKCMTYCEHCHKGIKNEEWEEHKISEKHLELEQKRFCEVCHMKYDVHENSQYHNSKKNQSDR